MSQFSRRNFLKTLGGASALATVPAMIRAAESTSRVVVIGGGFAGATAAKYLKHWAPKLDVTLVEANPVYYSPILSNLVVNGQMNLQQLGFNYNELQQKYSVNVIHDWVQGIDSAANKVELAGGAPLQYDRLIVAPGISFLPVEGHDFNKVPHAWKSGDQLLQLKQQLANMPAGENFVMSIPPAPYRCPPGPYERACLVADYLKTHKPGSRVIVLDANADILVEKEAFGYAFDTTYAGIVDYRTNVTIEAVDSDQRIAVTDQGNFVAGVLNVIPKQVSGDIIRSSGLANDSSGHWAVVDPVSYESTKYPGIHVIGDSQATGQPKAGHIANAEAKVCADAVIRLLDGGKPYGQPMTNSACYSPISTNTASWLTVVFRYDPTSGTMKPVPGSKGAPHRADRESYDDMFEWAESLFGDTFA